MLNTAVWMILAVLMSDPSTNRPVFVVQEPPTVVTLEECINNAKIIQADKSTNQVVLCMYPVPKSES